MQITQFEISADKTQMDITITDAATISALRLWKDFDYQDYDESIDLSGKLTASATEVIVVTLADISETSFDGVYFLQAEDPDEVSIDVTAELTVYKECILERVISANLGNKCLVEYNVETINAQSILKSLAYAIELKFIDEILKLLAMIQVYCSNECKSCGGYSNLTDYSYRVFNDPDYTIDSGDIV
ncbi:MAG: hypothetical protein ACSLE0_23375 [Chitinophagaceae bacterium]